MAGLLAVTVVRWKFCLWPSRRLWIWGLLVGGLVLTGLWVCGRGNGAVRIHHVRMDGNGMTWIEPVQQRDSIPPIWIVKPDVEVMGHHYGHAVRRAALDKGLSFAVTDFVVVVPLQATAVLSGEVKEIPACKQIVWLNPKGSAKGLSVPTGCHEFMVVWGDNRRGSEHLEWETWCQRNKAKWVVAEGADEYLTDWTVRIEN